MTLRVVGAGMGRTGTMSLKLALERLLNAPCYHMVEVFRHPEHIPVWHAAALGHMPDWHQFFAGYVAAVDWPPAAFWPEISAAFPEALVVLSVRDAESWWQSASATIFDPANGIPLGEEWRAMLEALGRERFTSETSNREMCIATYERNNAIARESVPADRFLEWRAADGWEPLCAALRVPVPAEPFPRSNSREEWAARRAAAT